MRHKSLQNAKLVVTVLSEKTTKKITTLRVLDQRTNEEWTSEQIKERGIEWFLDLADLKETLNWNLNGDSSKFQFSWGQSGKDGTIGYAYIFH